MARNPHLAATFLRHRNQLRSQTLWGLVRLAILPLFAVVLLVPLVRGLFLSFLDGPATHWGEGLEGATLRCALLLIGWLSIDVYGALVRGPDRAVLDIHPVNAGDVVVASLLQLVLARWWTLPVAGVVLGPLAWDGSVLLWMLAMWVVLSTWLLGLTASAMVLLLAVQVAEDPRYAGLLDLIRGKNPRPQAAFIYSPGVALLLTGLVVGRACQGARSLWEGQGGALWLLLPLAVALLCAMPLRRLADRSWFRASNVLAEIDARYAALEGRDEGLRVYLDWAVRFLPQGLRRYALRDLRHGWRSRRPLVVMAWLVGVAAFLAGWSEVQLAPGRAAVVGIGGTWLCAAVAVQLGVDEPAFLRAWLPPGGGSKRAARVLVVMAWLGPLWVLPTLSVWLRRGGGDALAVLGWLALALALAVPLAVWVGGLRRRALAVYVPLASVGAALLALGASR